MNVSYKNLIVYQKGHLLVKQVYLITQGFPRQELFGLVSQMRRCAISIVANIVEGYGRRTIKDKLSFLYISRGSLNELEYYFDLSYELKYFDNEKYYNLINLREEVGKLLNGFINSYQSKQ